MDESGYHRQGLDRGGPNTMTRIVYRDGRTVTRQTSGAPRPGLPTIRGGPITPFPTFRLIGVDEIRVGAAVVLGAVTGVAVGLLVARFTTD